MAKGLSVGAADAGITAADFSAVSTDSLLPMELAQRLPAAIQQSKDTVLCCFSRWLRSVKLRKSMYFV